MEKISLQSVEKHSTLGVPQFTCGKLLSRDPGGKRYVYEKNCTRGHGGGHGEPLRRDEADRPFGS